LPPAPTVNNLAAGDGNGSSPVSTQRSRLERLTAAMIAFSAADLGTSCRHAGHPSYSRRVTRLDAADLSTSIPQCWLEIFCFAGAEFRSPVSHVELIIFALDSLFVKIEQMC
jgi:hypothetical protein